MTFTLLTIDNQEIQLTLESLGEILKSHATKADEKDFQPEHILEKLNQFLSILLMGEQKYISDKQLNELIISLTRETGHTKLAKHLETTGVILPAQKTSDLYFTSQNQEKLKKLYLPATHSSPDIHQLITDLGTLQGINTTNSANIIELIQQGRFLPHQNTLRSSHAFSHMHLALQDDLNDIFDHLKSVAVNFQNTISSSINFSAIRPKMSTIKSTQGFSSGPVSFIKIYTSTFEILRQNLSTEFTPPQNFILNIHHPDILEYLIFIKNFPKNSSSRYLEFSIELSPSFIEALNQDEDYDLINPENGQTVNLLSAKNTFDLLVSTIMENPALGLIIEPQINHSWLEISGVINLAAYQDAPNLEQTLPQDLQEIQNYLQIQKSHLASHQQLPIKTAIQITGWHDFLIGQNIAYNSIANLETAKQLLSTHETSSENTIHHLTVNLQSPLLSTFQSSRGLETVDQLITIKTTLEGRESYQIHPQLQKLLQQYEYHQPEHLHDIQQQNSLQHLANLPSNIKNLFLTATEISTSFHLELQHHLEQLLKQPIDKKIYLGNTIEGGDEIKNSFIQAIHHGLGRIRLCQFEHFQKSTTTEMENTDANFLLNLGTHHKRRHREIQPPLFQVRKTEEITLPPIST